MIVRQDVRGTLIPDISVIIQRIIPLLNNYRTKIARTKVTNSSIRRDSSSYDLSVVDEEDDAFDEDMIDPAYEADLENFTNGLANSSTSDTVGHSSDAYEDASIISNGIRSVARFVSDSMSSDTNINDPNNTAFETITAIGKKGLIATGNFVRNKLQGALGWVSGFFGGYVSYKNIWNTEFNRNNQFSSLCLSVGNLSYVIELIEETNNNNAKAKLTSFVSINNTMGEINNRKQLRVLNILDMNIVPFDVHSLMKEVPFANLINYLLFL